MIDIPLAIARADQAAQDVTRAKRIIALEEQIDMLLSLAPEQVRRDIKRMYTELEELRRDGR